MFDEKLLTPRIRKLPRTDQGYPVPYFVAWVDGKPDFRAMDPVKLVQAVRDQFCWVCGEMLGTYKAFVIGPMCVVNRTSAEPPCHRDCAEFSAQVCPFLSDPNKGRRETNLPAHKEAAGLGLKRNPGVTMIWVTKRYKVYLVKAQPEHNIQAGILFEIGDPEEVLWYCKGRIATRDEILASFSSGIPSLQSVASEEGAEAVALLESQYQEGLRFVPT